jgi:threonine-phosphate decarboxylase
MNDSITSRIVLTGHNDTIYSLAEELKIQERKLLDFSVSVNPLGVSKKIKAELRKHLKYLHNYPDPEATRFRKRIGQYHGVDPETILCGNGSTALIYLILRVLRPQKVLLPAPTSALYEKAVRTVEAKGQKTEIEYFPLSKSDGFRIDPDAFIYSLQAWANTLRCRNESPVTADMVFLCNPNNPTGTLLGRDQVKRIAAIAREQTCYLIVDEAFIDFCPENSVIQEVGKNPYLIVLRTLTNFYALAGLRIGYGVFPSDLVARLKIQQEPWAVNSLAQRVAGIALKDKVYRKETLRLLVQEKQYLEKNFTKLGIEFYASDANFYLLKTDKAHEIYQHLRGKGILLGDCSDLRGLDSTYLRVAVKSHKENALLIKSLTPLLERKD